MLLPSLPKGEENTSEVKEMKEKNRELDAVIDEHTREITQLQTEMKSVFKQLNMQK